jgi:hypothetical protein
MAFHIITEAACIMIPYPSQIAIPMASMQSETSDTSFIDRVRKIFTICGRLENVVKIPPMKPITSGLMDVGM